MKRKKNNTRKAPSNQHCPDCNSRQGLIGKFVLARRTITKYLYCPKCGYDYSALKNLKKDVDNVIV